VRADNTNELDENFLVNLSNAQNGTISDSQGEGTILNDDTSLPQVRINDVAVTEGNSGTKNVTFTITLSKATFKTVTVKFATQNNTAVSSSDYTAKSGTLTFSAFQTSKTITVVTKGDTSIEPDETFFLNLSAPTNAFIADNRGVGTIVNDDKVAPPKPLVSISDVTGVEGNTGTRSFVFTITLSAPAPGAISVKYATSNGTASSSSDYTAKSGTVNFAAGETSKTVTITVKGDVTKEVDETFFVTLTNPIGASINKGVGKGTIRNDD
jgi:hypothetical protein